MGLVLVSDPRDLSSSSPHFASGNLNLEQLACVLVRASAPRTQHADICSDSIALWYVQALLGAGMLLIVTVVSSIGLLRCYKDFPLRQLQCLVILQLHVAFAMIAVGAVALLSPRTFPPIDSRRFGVGVTALVLACLQV